MKMKKCYDVLDAAPLSPKWHLERKDRISGTAAGVLSTLETINLVKTEASAAGVALETNLIEAIGLKDSSCVFGKTLWQIWAENRGSIPGFKGNAATKHGQKNEPLLRQLAESELGIIFEADVTAMSTKCRAVMASLDAIGMCPDNPEKEIIGEIKVPQYVSRQKFWAAKADVEKLTAAIAALSLFPFSAREETIAALKGFIALEEKDEWVMWHAFPELKPMLLGFLAKLTANDSEEFSAELLAEVPSRKAKKLYWIKRKQEVKETTARTARINQIEAYTELEFLVDDLNEKFCAVYAAKSVHEVRLVQRFEKFLGLHTPVSVSLNRKSGLAVNANLGYLLQMYLQMYVVGADYGYFIMGGVEEKDGVASIVAPIVEKVLRPSDEFYAQWIAYFEFIHKTYYEGEAEPPKLPVDEELLVELRKQSEAALSLALISGGATDCLEDSAEALSTQYREATEQQAKADARVKDLENRIKVAAEKLRVDGVDTVCVGNPSGTHIQVITKKASSVSWASFAKSAHPLLDASVYSELVAKNTKESEKTTIKLVVGS